MISPITASLPGSNAQLAKLKNGAKDFEAMLIQQMWKGSKQEEGGPNQAMTDMGMQAVSKGMAAHGGFGIAKMIEKSIK